MDESIKLSGEETEKTPLNREERVKQLKSLPTNQKTQFMPPAGLKFTMGPFVYEVAITSPIDLKFTAKLYDVKVEGVNND